MIELLKSSNDWYDCLFNNQIFELLLVFFSIGE